MKSESFVSVVSVLDAHCTGIVARVKEIHSLLDEAYSDYEIVLVFQGPIEETALSGVDEDLLQIPSIRCIQLSSRVHPDIAYGAGLENAIGDFVVLMDFVDDPASVIPETVDLCKKGYDVIVGTAESRCTLAYRFLRVFASFPLRAADYHLPRNASGLRCLSRRAVNAVTQIGRFHQKLYMKIQKTGYPLRSYGYELNHGGRKRKNLFTGLSELTHLLVFNSSKPLRWMSMIGFGGSLVSTLFAFFSIFVHFVKNKVVEGWTTQILFMSILFMLQFLMLAFFGEYLGRLLDSQGDHADYSVVYEKNSRIMVNQDRVNVLNESISTDSNQVQSGRDR